MKEFLDKLKITGDIIETDKGFELELSQEDYARVYTKLDTSELLEEDDERCFLTLDKSTIAYVSDNYRLYLIADFTKNRYKLTIEEN